MLRPFADSQKKTLGYTFWCPGCRGRHPFWTTPTVRGHCWIFNGDLLRPTFTPSLVMEATFGQVRCHLFLRDGQIQFLSDCGHELAGKTVPLEREPPLDANSPTS